MKMIKLVLIIFAITLLFFMISYFLQKPNISFFKNFKTPIIIAHRGASSLAPENTLSAFKKAKALKATGIELDIHLCKSGELVVIHDYEINRTARNADGSEIKEKLEVENLTLEELRKYDFGIWYGNVFKGEKIPTLKEVLDLIGHNTLIDIEIKGNKGKPYKDATKALAKFLQNYSKINSIKNIFVSSFNPQALSMFKKESKKLGIIIPVAIIYSKHRKLPNEVSFYSRYFYSYDILKPHYFDFIYFNPFFKLIKKPVYVWTVDEDKYIQKVINLKADGIISNKIQNISFK